MEFINPIHQCIRESTLIVVEAEANVKPQLKGGDPRIIEFRGCVVRTGGGLIPLADSINIFLYFCTVMFASRQVEII